MQTHSFQATNVLSKYEADLVTEGLISTDQLTIANISKDNLGLDIGSVLIKKKFVTEKQLLEFVAKKINVPFVCLDDYQLDPELVHRVPFHLIRQHLLIPLAKKDNEIVVAMANPFDSFALDDLRDALKMAIEPCLASAFEIEKIIDRFFSGNLQEDKKMVTIEVTTSTDSESESETRKMQEMALGPKIVATVNNIIAKASAEGASDIHIEPNRKNIQIRYRIDGMLRDGGTLNKSMQLPVISRIKILAGLDIAEKRVPQDGRVRVLLVGKPLDMRISTCPTQHGEKVVVRLLVKDTVQNIESLGFATNERRLFSDIISKSHGIFLSTGPTRSGKSTTLYAALSRLNSPDKNVISIEDPIENEIEGINQVAVNTKTGLTFATVLRSVLRQDPDVIMIGEIRDAETAEIAVRAAITGHMVLSTLHTNTAAGAIPRLKDMGVEPFLLSSALKGVMAQRLVRRICNECKTQCEIDANKIPQFTHLIKSSFFGKGCKTCNYTGYKGRAGIFELAEINDKVRDLIDQNSTEEKIVKAFREHGIKSIVEHGIEKINEGITTVEEVLRVTQED